MTWHPDIPHEYRNQIVTGDARVLAERIPDESIDLILCDPVYDRIQDYKWLADLAERILVYGGNLIMQTGHYHLPSVYRAVNGQLDYVWTIAEQLTFGRGSLYQHRIICSWKPYVWYSKGKRKGRWVFDWLKGGGRSKVSHVWGDSPEIFIELVDRLTDKPDTIFDPFTGGGTVPAVCKMLHRNYIAFEIDPDTAELARERVRNTQPPLPLQYHEQLELLPGD